MAEPYNPLDKLNLGRSVVEAMLALPATPLPQLEPFDGAGIYAIYYHGTFPPYAALTAAFGSPNEAPIYVGKAVPSGARRGASLTASAKGRYLFRRISEHRDSLEAATNLLVDDFSVRSLVVDDIWIPLGESLLISTFRPVWNQLIDGFGNHDPGAGRYAGLRPLWDLLHPGREWADRCQQRLESREDVERLIAQFLAASDPT
jgi:Eco29kI restriction endonuclease